MIPKIIHYCWFGHGEKPNLAKMCIESWRKYCPDYVIKEWNEDNFDLDLYPYTREAYEKRKYAFVTDVVRLYALYHEGGIYMDTDVEVLQSLDRFLVHHAFSGFQQEQDETKIPTGIMGSEKGGKWAEDNLAYYDGRHFVLPDGALDTKTNVKTITELMIPYGLKLDNTYQDFPGYITFYPKEFFCPIEHLNDIRITDNSYTIHYFAGSWLPWSEKLKKRIIRTLGKKQWNRIVSIRSFLRHITHV